MNKIANFTRSFSSGRYLILVRQANLYKINIFSYTKISMKTLWIIWNLSGNPKKCGTRTPTNRDGWQRGAIADKFLIKAADIFDRYTSTSRLSRPSTNAQRVHQFREVAIESLAKSSMLTPWRNIKKEIKKMMRWERERRARKATSRVIARISKCVYKLGHRRVCSLIRHSDAEEWEEEEEEEEERVVVMVVVVRARRGGSRDLPGD